MFSEIFKPYLEKVHPCSLDEVRHNIQKERRIIDVLEPVLNQHRLIIDPKVIKLDYESCQKYPLESQLRYQLIYQLSRITGQKGSLTHDDRLDALAMAVQYWVDQMAQNADTKRTERKEDLLSEELRKMADSYYNRKGGRSSPNWL
jgi:hypothetical protein